MSDHNGKVIVQSDYYNALYDIGKLEQQGKPEYVNAETLARLFPAAAIYWVPQHVYDDALDGEGYPENLHDFPLQNCERIR